MAAVAATGHEGDAVLKLYFLDNSSKMLMVDPEISAGEVCDMIAGRMGFADGGENSSRYFALFESVNGSIPRRALGRSEVVLNVQHGCAKIIYMMKLFMPTALEMIETDPIVLHLQYIQSLHSVITGTHFYNEIPIILKLAALDVQAKYGPHDPSIHQVGFLTQRLQEFIPANLFGKKEKLDWEEMIYKEHQALLSRDDLNAKLEYVKICQSWECNGCLFYEVRQTCLKSAPARVLLGINTNGIYLINPTDRSVLQKYKLSEVYRWGFKPGSNFYFEIKGSGQNVKGPIYEFGTTQGNRMSEMLTDYANALLHELGIANKKANQAADVMSAFNNATKVREIEVKQKLKEEIANSKGEKHDRLQEEFYALQIQCLWRGYKERCKFDKMIEELETQLHVDEASDVPQYIVEDEKLKIAAIKMQAVWRGANVRADMLKQLEELEAEAGDD
jgi:hypothetical protein